MKLLSVFGALFLTLGMSAQCTAKFIYALSPNGTITFSNTSVHVSSVSPVYIWDTGNGMTFTTTALSQTVGTAYTSNGVYPVTLTMQDNGPQACFSSTVQFIAVFIQGCPLIALKALARSGGISIPTVSFSSVSTGTLPTSTYTWNFGDGTTSNLISSAHTYTRNGVYGYTLTVRNSSTCSAFSGVTPDGAYMLGSGLTCVCSYTPGVSYTIGPAGLVNFQASGTSTSVAGYLHWNFDDYTWNLNNTASVSHLYFNGTYNPMYTVNIGTVCGPYTPSVAVTITNNPCHANAAYTYTVGSGGTVQLSKTAPPSNTNIAYLWKFGDGTTSSQVNPTHTYPSAGNYSVTLISYDLRYPLGPVDTNYLHGPCRQMNVTNLNITGIPCVADPNFTLFPSGIPHHYLIYPLFPYNVSAASWSWGDGSTSNSLYPSHTYSAAGSYDICLTVTTTCGAISGSCTTQSLARGTSGDMVYVTVLPPALSIEENTGENINLELFPNPNEGILNLRLNKEIGRGEIEIYDLLGKKVYQTSSAGTEKAFMLDLHELNNGIYFLHLKLLQGDITEKFIIAR